jgi:hypothetical protein
MNFEFLDFLKDSIHFCVQLFQQKDFEFYYLKTRFLRKFQIMDQIN